MEFCPQCNEIKMYYNYLLMHGKYRISTLSRVFRYQFFLQNIQGIGRDVLRAIMAEGTRGEAKFLIFIAGVYIFHFKIWVVGWLGKKYDNLLRKNANIRGKRGNFHCIFGVKYHFGKGGGGKNINYLDNMHPCFIVC